MADYHSLLMRAVANLPNSGPPSTRAAIYDRARKALLNQLRSLRPPLPESDIAREEKALDAAIAEIEGEYWRRRRTPRRRRCCAASPRRRRPRPPPEPGVRARAAPRAAPSAPPRTLRPQRHAAASGPPAPRAPLAAAVAGRRPCGPRRRRGAAASRTPVCGVGQPRRAAAPPSPARSQTAAAMANPPSYGQGQAGPLRRSARGAARTRVCREWRRLTQPGRSDRPGPMTRNASGAPPVVATRPDEPAQSAEAPQVAAEVDRPGLARQAGRGDPAPGRAGRRRRQAETLAMDRAAVLLGVVLAVAAAAILMRQKPQDLAIKPPVEAQQPRAAEPPAKIAERVEPPPPAAPSASRSRERAASGPAGRSRRSGAGKLPLSGQRRARARRAGAVGGPGGDAGRLGRQSAEAGREPGLDGLVARFPPRRTSRRRSR